MDYEWMQGYAFDRWGTMISGFISVRGMNIRHLLFRIAYPTFMECCLRSIEMSRSPIQGFFFRGSSKLADFSFKEYYLVSPEMHYFQKSEHDRQPNF